MRPRLAGSEAEAGVEGVADGVADWDQSGWTVPLGASGHPGSPHFADQITAWSEQRLSPMLYSWPRIEANAEGRQRLEPSEGYEKS